MTFIQPSRNKSILNMILILMGIFTVVTAIYLVMLYNKVVNLNHGLSQLKSELGAIQTRNLAAQTQIFDLINSSDPSKIGNLIPEKNPQYLTWAFASDY